MVERRQRERSLFDRAPNDAVAVLGCVQQNLGLIWLVLEQPNKQGRPLAVSVVSKAMKPVL
jgi:hypothetical protein